MKVLSDLLKPAPLKLVIFDLDGTLVDSVMDLKCALDAMYDELGMPRSTLDQVRTWVGNGAEVLVKRALSYASKIDPAICSQYFESAYTAFLHHYEDANGRHAECYRGALPLLTALQSQQVLTAIVTNKPKQFTLPLLAAKSLTVDCVISGDCVGAKKPDPEPVMACLRRLNVAAESAVMVGDSINDIEAAKASRVATVAVSYGYNHGVPILASAPDLHIDSLEELR